MSDDPKPPSNPVPNQQPGFPPPPPPTPAEEPETLQEEIEALLPDWEKGK